MQPSTTMTYRGYSFTPVPLMNVQRDPIKQGDGALIGETYRITLSNELVITSSEGSLKEIRALQDDLQTAFSVDGGEFLVKCGTNEVLKAYPRVVGGVNFDQGVWVNRSPYTIELEFDEIYPGSGLGYPITSFSEDWSLEFADDKSVYSWNLPSGSGLDANPVSMRLTHSVSATGKHKYNSSGLIKPAWQNARDYVVPYLGYDSTEIQGSGVINLNSALFSAYNHVRSISQNEADGSYSVTESWFVTNTGSGIVPKVIEDFTINTRKSTETALVSVSIEGSIQGLETRSYGNNPGDFTITEGKYVAASGAWNTIKDRLLGRCNLVLDTIYTTKDLNYIPLNEVVGHNPSQGVITYSREYDTRNSNCVAGALSESIVITDNNPADVYASLLVPGKVNGPVLQSLDTVTAPSKEVNVEIVMEAPTGCPSSFAALLSQSPKTTIYNSVITPIQDYLEANYNQVFKDGDTNSWDIKTGRFSCNVRWTYSDC